MRDINDFFCMFKRTITLVISSLVLSSCTLLESGGSGINSSNNPDSDNAIIRSVYLSSIGVPYRTDALKIIENWKPDTYYTRIKVTGKKIPSALGRCNNESTNLFNALKRFVGINNANAFTITADVSVYGNNIYTDLPLLIVARYEKTKDQPFPKCVTHSLNGNITPFFRATGGLEINITYKLRYSQIASISTINDLVTFATSITSAAGIQGRVVTALATPAASSISKSLDKNLSNTFSSEGEDQFNNTFMVNPPIGGTRVDATQLNLGKLFTDQPLLNKMSLNVEMSYDASVIGILRNKKLQYPDTPDGVLLTKSLIRKDGGFVVMNVGKALRKGLVQNVNTQATSRFNSKKDKESMASFCSALDDFFGEELDLTAKDRLVLKWAAVTEYSKYDRDMELRSPKCFTSYKDRGSNSEQDRLYKINPNYFFPVPITESNIGSMITLFKDGTNNQTGFGSFTGEDFSFNVEGDPTPYLVPRKANSSEGWSNKGKIAIENIRSLFSGGYLCYTQPKKDEGRYSNKLGIFLVIRKEISGTHQGFKTATGRPIAPVVIEYTLDRKKVKYVGVGEVVTMRELHGFPLGWPNEYSAISCKGIKKKPMDKVKLYSDAGLI